MVLTSRTFLFILCCAFSAATVEGINGGVIQKRLQLFKNAANHVRTITFPVEGKQHRMRRDCHPTCHGHHGHEHHHHHHGYGHHHHHHQKHDYHHIHGHHHKSSFGRAIYQDPYYHVSPQLFYFNKKPLNHGFNQYYSNKFSPYWFNRYNYLPYQMKPLTPTYSYHLKPLYYYLRNPQVLTPVPQVTWIKPHEYHFYPIDNQVSSEDSMSVADPPNNPVNHNVYDSSYEANGMTNAQIPVQDLDLDTENNQSNENDNAPSITDLVGEETSTTPILENKIHNVNIVGESTSYNNAEHTTHQYTPMIDLDGINESSTPSVRITGSFDNGKEDTTALNDLNRVYTTKSDDSYNFGISDSSRTTEPSYEEKNTVNVYSTHEPIAVTDSLEHEVKIDNEQSLKYFTKPTTSSPLETFHDWTTEILPERGQEIDADDNFSSITGADDSLNGGLKYETSGGTTIPEIFRTKLNDYHTSTTSIYDVTSPKIVTEKNEVDLLNYDQTFTTVENPKNDYVEEHKGSPILQTVPEPHFEEQTTMDSHFSNEASTFFLEPNDRHYTTTESPKKDEMREYEGSSSSQTISQSRFDESTTMISNFNDEASSETLDEELLLFEEFIKTIMESETTQPEISYSSELFQSKTGIKSDELNEKTTVRSFIEDAIDSSVKESSAMDDWRSITIFPAYTSITGSELIPDSNFHRDLEDESSLKTTVSSNSLEITTPIPKESLKDHTVPVTSSSISTDFDRDYEEGPAEKYKMNTPSIFTDFTVDSENEFSKSKAQTVTTFSPSSIYTDSTENSKVRLSEFKFESNSIPTTPTSVYNYSTENYLLLTPSSLKSVSSDSSIINVSFDKASTDNEDYENVTGNTEHEVKFDSVEITTNHYTKGNWNMEESIKSEDENNNISNEILAKEEKYSTTGAWNEKISIISRETTTLRSHTLKPLETGEELSNIEKENNSSVSNIEDYERQNVSESNIATEKISLIPEYSSYVTEKYSENYNIHLDSVTSKSNPIDSVVFQTIETTTNYQEKMEQTPESSVESDFGNMKTGSIAKFSDSTTLETFDSSTVEYRDLYANKFNNNIQSMENSSTIFEHYGSNKSSADSVFTTEPSYVTDSNIVSKESNSEYENENPTTETHNVYFHGNLFEEIKKAIINTPASSDDHYPEVTDANILYDTTSLFRTDQYEQITGQPSKMQSLNSIEKLSTGEDDSEKISGEDPTESWFAENTNNTDHDDLLLSLESSSEANFNSKKNISSEKIEVQVEPLNKNDEDSVNEAKKEESDLNELNLSQNISQEEKNLQSTSSNYNSVVDNNMDQTTLSSEAGTKLNAYSSNEEDKEGKDEVVSGQTVLNETVDEHNTSKVINEIQSNVDDYSDGVIKVYEELDTSFPSSEIAIQNGIYKEPATVENWEPHVSEDFEPVTERKDQHVEEKTTEILPSKQFHESLFIENLNETENQAAGTAAKNNSIDETDDVESSTRAQLSDYNEVESIVGENKGEEIVSATSSSANDNSPFHLDLLNINGTTYDNSEKELTNKSSMIEEVTYYNIKNLEENSNVDNLFVAVNDEETNRTGLLSVDELIDVNDDDLTNNYELRRSVRYDYNPYYIVSDSTLNVRKPYSNNMEYQNDRSAKPRYIVKRDVMKADASQIPLESGEIVKKREIRSEALAILGRDLTSSEEAYDDDDDDVAAVDSDYNEYGPLSNPKFLKEKKVKEDDNEEEEDNKSTNDSGPSIKELFDFERLRNKQ